MTDGDSGKRAYRPVAVLTSIPPPATSRIDRIASHEFAFDLRTYAVAVAVGRACNEAGLCWYDDPSRDAGRWQFAHCKLRQCISIPIHRTEHAGGVELMAAFIVKQATDFLRTESGVRPRDHRRGEDRPSGPNLRPGRRDSCPGRGASTLPDGGSQHHLLDGGPDRAALHPCHEPAYTDGCFAGPSRPPVRFKWEFIDSRCAQLHDFEWVTRLSAQARPPAAPSFRPGMTPIPD